jgi:GT2 family glycosyltransferase
MEGDRAAREQAVALALTRAGHRVFYIAPDRDVKTQAALEPERLDGSDRLFGVRLPLAEPRGPDDAAPSLPVRTRMLADVATLLERTYGAPVINILHHAFWLPIAEAVPNSRLVYDWSTGHLCTAAAPEILALSAQLLARADLVIAGSPAAAQIARRANAHVRLAPDPAAVPGHLASMTVPLASVIIVTYNNLALTKQCLASIDAMTRYPRYELIVVDNASTDGTPAFLEEWRAGHDNRRVIVNPANKGFAAANNQGLAIAAGDYLVLLNNDTVVTAGWLGTLIGHLRRDPTIALIGPVTNETANDARIQTAYADLEGMHAEARRWTLAHIGRTRPMHTLTFFCVMMPRRVCEDVGPLDEAFAAGMFEDDDYCRRVEQTGGRIVCALDVFVHHHFSPAFDAMGSERKWELFERNRRLYETKWGTWKPFRPRD